MKAKSCYYVDSDALFERLVDEQGKKLTLQDAADLTGLSRSAISRLLKGDSLRCAVTVSTAAVLSRKFGREVVKKN